MGVLPWRIRDLIDSRWTIYRFEAQVRSASKVRERLLFSDCAARNPTMARSQPGGSEGPDQAFLAKPSVERRKARIANEAEHQKRSEATSRNGRKYRAESSCH